MAKVTGPILSIRARGQIGKSQIYSQWRGIPYARQYNVPANPRTTGQLLTRDVFAWLQNLWRSAPAVLQNVWLEAARGRPFTDRNRHTQVNLPLLRVGTTVTAYLGSPGVASGPALVSATPTPGVGTLALAVVSATLPTGWAAVQAVAVLVKQQDPHDAFIGPVSSDTDAAGPAPNWALSFAGLAAASYVWSTWVEYQRPDGSFAASIAESGVSVVT